jgi:hypothetical protein
VTVAGFSFEQDFPGFGTAGKMAPVIFSDSAGAFRLIMSLLCKLELLNFYGVA